MGQVEGSLKKDCDLIMEALRRLIDGTCCLTGEEKICAWDLFHKTRVALMEHIQLEEKCLLSELPEEERRAHQLEHKRLLELLERAQFNLEISSGELFRAYLNEFVQALKFHHEHDPLEQSWFKIDQNHSIDRTLEQIQQRANESFL